MFPRLLVVFFVETPNQLLEKRAHAVIVEAWKLYAPVSIQDRLWAEIDVRRKELFDEGAEGIGVDQRRNLMLKFELFQDLLNVGRETLEVSLEVRS